MPFLPALPWPHLQALPHDGLVSGLRADRGGQDFSSLRFEARRPEGETLNLPDRNGGTATRDTMHRLPGPSRRCRSPLPHAVARTDHFRCWPRSPKNLQARYGFTLEWQLVSSTPAVDSGPGLTFWAFSFGPLRSDGLASGAPSRV